jgi:hypothetical protein
MIVAALLGCNQRAREVQGGAELKQSIDQMMPPVERATGLKFKRHPVVLRRSRAQVRQYVVHKFDQDVPPDELAGVQAAYRLLGLLPDTLDLRRTMVDLLTEQVAGYYDPDSNALYVGADVDPAQVRLVVSHEMVHALQAQYVDLDSLIQQKNHNDRRTAVQAVLEGQAMLAQILVLMPEQKVESLPNFWDSRRAVGQQQQQMPIFEHAPLWLRETVIFPYLAGADFVRWFTHHHPGEEPFGSLMPASTEQILHPDRYAAGDRPISLSFVGPAPDTVRYENDLGEFETRLLLQQLLDSEPESAALATGWGGDRYEVLGNAANVIVWYSVWDTPLAADRFAAGLKRGWLRRRPGGASDRRYDIRRLTVDGKPGVRLVDAPTNWAGWKRVPGAKIVGG